MVRLLQSLALPLGHVAVRKGIIQADFPYRKGLRGGAKVATIHTMTENELLPESENDEPVGSTEPADQAEPLDDPAESGEPEAEVSLVEEEIVVSDDGLIGQDWSLGDIDAALAAVASLSELSSDAEVDLHEQAAPTFVPEMSMPPLTTLKRGQLGSLVPALLLIGLGAWLTLTTTTGAPPAPLVVAGAVIGGLVVTLLAYWISSGRWSRGALFFALVVLLVAGVIGFSLQPNGLNLTRAYPLLIVAVGLALVLDGLLARPANTRLIAPGALLVLAGVVGLTVTLDLIPANMMTIAAPLAPVVLIVVVVLWLLPLVFRRRS